MAMDLLTTIDIVKYFSDLFESSHESIRIDDISTDPQIPAQEVHITIHKARRLLKLEDCDLKFIAEHKLATVKLVVIRKIRIFKFEFKLWQQEI